MLALVSLIVPLRADGSDLIEVARAIDAQTLPYSAFEVTYIASGAPAATSGRLAELTRRRPNVTVARSTAEAVAASTAEWVVTVPADCASGLQPETLGRLLGFVGEHGCDVVLGRVDAADGTQVSDRLANDTPRVVPLPPAALLGSLVVLLARRLAVSVGLPMDEASAAAVLNAANDVGILGTYPCTVLAAPQPTRPALRIVSASTSWSDGRLTVAIEGTAEPRSLVRFAARSGVREHWLPGATVTGPDGAVSAKTTIDIRNVLDGAPLGPGSWLVTVGAHGDGGDWTQRIPVPVPTAALQPAIVDGVLVAPGEPPRGRALPGLTLDIGASRGSAVPPFTPEQAQFTESAGGTVLRVPLDVHASGDARVAGYVALDGLRLAASIEVVDATATLVAHLSGLSGTSALGTGFGNSRSNVGSVREAGPETPTGMSVEISPIGLMRLVPTPTRAQVPDAEPKTSRPPLVPAPSGRRRWVPSALEPAVTAAAQSPTARRIYRQLTHRTGAH